MQLKWRLQGFKLFKVKYYKAAIQCFRNASDEVLVKRCQAYEHADAAQSLKGQAEAKIAIYQDKYNPLSKTEKNKYKR